jgi:hypothetical protein
MTELKPAAPVFRTWWKEWSDAQKRAFNAAIEAGAAFGAAVAAASAVTEEEVAPETPVEPVKVAKTRTRKPKEA